MHILLVENDEKVAGVIARSLHGQSYAVNIAESGEDGVRLAVDATYDVILLEVKLPGMSGFEVRRELRRVGTESPILMLTACGLIEERVQGLDSGADDCLTKPFALPELQARVRALFRRSGPNGTRRRLAC